MDDLCGLRRLTVCLGGRTFVLRREELEAGAWKAVAALRQLRGEAWNRMAVGSRHSEVLFQVLCGAFERRFGEPSLTVLHEAAAAAEGMGQSVDDCPSCCAVGDGVPVASA